MASGAPAGARLQVARDSPVGPGPWAAGGHWTIEGRGQEGADGARPDGERQPVVAVVQDRDLLEELALDRGIVRDPALHEGGYPAPGGRALGEQRRHEDASVVAQVASVPAPQHEIGEGSWGRLIHRAAFYGAPGLRVAGVPA
jgi:hypothetical protein